MTGGSVIIRCTLHVDGAATDVLGQSSARVCVSVSEEETVHSLQGRYLQAERQRGKQAHRSPSPARSEVLREDSDVAARARPAAAERTIREKGGVQTPGAVIQGCSQLNI